MLQTYKGWIYVAGTALLLYFLSVREFHVRDKVQQNLAINGHGTTVVLNIPI